MTTVIVFALGMLAGGVAVYLNYGAINTYLKNWKDGE